MALELTQAQKDEANAKIKEIAAQGGSQQDIDAYKQEFEASVAKTSTPEDQTDTSGDTDFTSDDGSWDSAETPETQGPPTMEDFSKTAGRKKGDRFDEDGEVINLARDFGEVGELVESIPFFGDLIDDIYGSAKAGWAQGQTVDDALALFAGGEDTDPETIQKYIDAVDKSRNQPVSKEMQDFNQIYEESGGGTWGFIKAIAQNPSVGPTTIVSSMVAMLNPASAAGAGVGAGTGAAIGSAATPIGTGVGAVSGAFAGAGGVLETGSSFTEFLQEALEEKGLEFNEEGIAEVLGDEDTLASIRGRSAARGGVIAIIDGLTGGLAGKAATATAKNAKRLAKLKGTLAATAVEGAGGGIGEASARLAVGQELDAREIGLEIVGEFGVGVGIAKAAFKQPAYEINGQRVKAKEIEAVLEKSPELASTLDVTNDKKLQDRVNETISDNDKINNNKEYLATDEVEARDSKLEEVRQNLESVRKAKNPEEKAAFEQAVKESRKELKQVVKEQDKRVNKLSQTDKEELAFNNKAISKNNAFIQEQTAKYEGKEMPSNVKSAIERYQKTNEQAQIGINEIRAKQEQKVQEAEAVKTEEAQEQELEAEAEELGITPEKVVKAREEAQEVVEEDVETNTKSFENLSEELGDYGVEINPAEGSVNTDHANDFIPLGRDGDAFTKGDFEKTIESFEPRPLTEVKKAERAIKRDAKANGFEANTSITKLEDGTAVLTGNIKSQKREENLSQKFTPEPEPAAEVNPEIEAAAEAVINPEGNVVGEKVAVKEGGPVKQRKARSEAEQKAAPTDFVTPDRYKGVEQISPDTFKLSNPKQIHKLRNDVAGRNYEVVENEDGTVTLSKGKPSFNVSESKTEFSIQEGTATEVDRIKNLSKESEDGATFNQDGTKYDGGGLVLPIASENLKASELTPDRIEAFKKKHAKYLGAGSKIGIYKFPGKDEASIDLNVIVPSNKRKRAVEIGKKLGQESLFDLDTFENVKTGETGTNPKTIGPSAAKRIADEFKEEDRAGIASPEDLAKAGIDESKIFNKAQKGQSYVLTPLTKHGAVVDADKSIGGKSGFASGGDARESIQAAGKQMSIADAMQLAENIYEEGPEGATGQGLREFLGDAAGVENISEAGSVIPAFSKIQYKASGNQLDTNAIEQMRKKYDETVGYEGAHLNLSNPVSVGVENTLNLSKKGKPKPKSKPTGTRADEVYLKGGSRTVDFPLRTEENLEKNLILGKDVVEKEGTQEFESSFDRREVSAEAPAPVLPKSFKNIVRDKKTKEAVDNFISKPNDPTTQRKLFQQLKPFLNYVGQSASRNQADVQETQGAARAAAISAITTGKYNNQAFNPTDIKSATGQLMGFARDAVRNYYTTEGSPAGTSGRHSKSNADLNDVRRAVREIEKTEGLLGSGKVKVGGKGKSTSKRIDFTNPQEVADHLNEKVYPEKFKKAQAAFKAGERKTEPVLKTASAEQVQSILDDESRFEGDLGAPGAQGQDVLDDIAADQGQDLSGNLEKLRSTGGNRLSDIFGIDGTSLESQIKDIVSQDIPDFKKDSRIGALVADQIDSKTINSKLNQIVKAVSLDDLPAARKLKEYITDNYINNIEGRAKPMRDLRNFLGRFVGAEIEGNTITGKTTPSPQFSLDEGSKLAQEPAKATEAFNEKVAGALRKAFPNNSISTDLKSFNEAASKIKDFPTGVKGFLHEGKIYIHPDAATKDTAIHEFGHLWAQQLQRSNPKLWKRGVELLKGSAFARKVFDNPQYKKYLNEGTPGRFWEEVMANALGKKGAEIFERNQEKAGAWDKFMNKVGDWLKKKLDISSKKDYQDLTLDDWLNVGAASILSGNQSAFNQSNSKISPRTEFSVSEDLKNKNDNFNEADINELKAESADSAWYKKPFSAFVPPSADDYHGLISKIKDIIPNIDTLTNEFIDNHHQYIEDSTAARDTFEKANKGLNKLDNRKGKAIRTPYLSTRFGKIKGVEVNNGQAIQAIVNGIKSPELDAYAAKPEVKQFINSLQDAGILRVGETLVGANPMNDLVDYISNDLYKKNFESFNNKKNDIFTDKVRDKVKTEKGSKFYEALDNSLKRMSNGKSVGGPTSKIGQAWNNFLQGSVGVTMFFNLRSAALQTLSILNYATETKSPMKFLGNLMKPSTFAEAKALFNSSYLKERRARAGFDVNANEMLSAARKGNLSGFTQKLLNKGFIATSAVDSIAVAFGGAAFIKTEMSNGSTRAEAIKAWKEKSEEAQQSSRPDRVSQMQTEPVSKFILAFANTPQQYFRLSQKAFREIRQGKNVKGNMAKIGYYMAVQNAIFTAAQSASLALLSGLSGDDEEDKKALSAYNSMMGTVLRGMGLVGAVADAGKNVIFEAYRQEGKKNPDHIATALKSLSVSPPLNRKVQDLVAIGRAYNYDNEDKEITAVSRAAAFANLPADWFVKKGKAIKELQDDQYTKFAAFMQLAGWSEYQFSKKEKDDEFDFDFDDDSFDFDDDDFDF